MKQFFKAVVEGAKEDRAYAVFVVSSTLSVVVLCSLIAFVFCVI
jgi:hypothetical protein